MRVSPVVQFWLSTGSAAAFGVHKPHQNVAPSCLHRNVPRTLLFQDLMNSETESVEESPLFQPKAPSVPSKPVEEKEEPPVVESKEAALPQESSSRPAIQADSFASPTTTTRTINHVGDAGVPSMFEQMNQVSRRSARRRSVEPTIQKVQPTQPTVAAITEAVNTNDASNVEAVNNDISTEPPVAEVSTPVAKTSAPSTPKAGDEQSEASTTEKETEAVKVPKSLDTTKPSLKKPDATKPSMLETFVKAISPKQKADTDEPTKPNKSKVSAPASSINGESTTEASSDITKPIVEEEKASAPTNVVNGASTTESGIETSEPSTEATKVTSPSTEAASSTSQKADTAEPVDSTASKQVESSGTTNVSDQTEPPVEAKPVRTSFAATSLFEQMNQAKRGLAPMPSDVPVKSARSVEKTKRVIPDTASKVGAPAGKAPLTSESEDKTGEKRDAVVPISGSAASMMDAKATAKKTKRVIPDTASKVGAPAGKALLTSESEDKIGEKRAAVVPISGSAASMVDAESTVKKTKRVIPDTASKAGAPAVKAPLTSESEDDGAGEESASVVPSGSGAGVVDADSTVKKTKRVIPDTTSKVGAPAVKAPLTSESEDDGAGEKSASVVPSGSAAGVVDAKSTVKKTKRVIPDTASKVGAPAIKMPLTSDSEDGGGGEKSSAAGPGGSGIGVSDAKSSAPAFKAKAVAGPRSTEGARDETAGAKPGIDADSVNNAFASALDAIKSARKTTVSKPAVSSDLESKPPVSSDTKSKPAVTSGSGAKPAFGLGSSDRVSKPITSSTPTDSAPALRATCDKVGSKSVIGGAGTVSGTKPSVVSSSKVNSRREVESKSTAKLPRDVVKSNPQDETKTVKTSVKTDATTSTVSVPTKKDEPGKGVESKSSNNADTAKSQMLTATTKVTRKEQTRGQVKKEPNATSPSVIDKNAAVKASSVPGRTLTPLEKKYASQAAVSKVDPKPSAPSQPKAATTSTGSSAGVKSPPDEVSGKPTPFRTLTPLEEKFASDAASVKPSVVRSKEKAVEAKSSTIVQAAQADKEKPTPVADLDSAAVVSEAADDGVLFFAAQVSSKAEECVDELETTVRTAQEDLESKLEELKSAQSIWNDEKKAYLDLIGKQTNLVAGIEDDAEASEKAMEEEAKATQDRLEREINEIQESLSKAKEDLKEEREAAVEIESLNLLFDEQLAKEQAHFEKEKRLLDDQILEQKDRLIELESQLVDERDLYWHDQTELQEQFDFETVKLQAIVADLDTQLARFKQDRSDLKQLLKDQSERLVESTTKLTEERSQFQTDRSSLEKAFREEKEKLERLVRFQEKEQAQFEEAKNDLEMAIVYEKIKVKNLSSQLENEEQEFRRRIEGLEEKIAKEKASIAKVEAHLKQEHARMASELGQLKDELKEEKYLRRSKRKGMSREASETRKLLTKRWKDVREKTKEMRKSLPEQYENQILEAKNSVSQLEIDLKQAKETSRDLNATLAEITLEKDRLISGREEVEIRYKTTLDQRDGAIADLRKELETLYDDIYMRDEKIAKYEDNFDELLRLAAKITQKKMDELFNPDYSA